MIPLRDDVPTRTFPILTIVIIGVNVAIYLYQLTLDQAMHTAMVYKWAYIPIEYTKGIEVIPGLSVPYGTTILTSMFLHGGFLHLAGNMLYLWIFGNNIEDHLGRIKFIIFYVISGLAAVGVFTLVDPSSKIPMIGASGAIAGVMGAYMVLYPKARVHTIIFLGFFVQSVRVPAKILLVFWFALQVIYGLPSLLGSSQGGVAWFAHVGGFVFGWLYFILSRQRPAYEYWG